MAIVDEYPFPFDKPMGQELMRVMAGLYRTERDALIFTQPFGVDPLMVPPNLNAIHLWFELLRMLATQNTVRDAVQAARDQFPKNPNRPFLDALLADRLAPVSAEPISNQGPAFDDSITTPEALLFFDDLTMPAGQVPNLIRTLERMVSAAPAICLLRVRNALGEFFGTGFRIGAQRVLTNHHVLFPKNQMAITVRADFGFDVDSSGASLPVTSLTGDVGTIRGEDSDDWAVIDVAQMDGNWPILSLDGAPAPKVGDAAYILQHPSAQQKRLGFVRNTISHVDDGVVRYLTDTQPGSSGAPVFDTDGRLIALHHAGGSPTEVAGKPPVSKNEGIRISRVKDRLAANGVTTG
jgi:V8-like Glu-specific endopeptidase